MLNLMSTFVGFLLLFFIVNPLPTTAQLPAVLDTAGNPLQPGVQYYILPSTASGGGGTTLVNRNGSCPLYVGQDARAGARGLPVLFNPFVSDENIIRESSNFAVSFFASSTCNQPTDWVRDIDDGSGGRVLITTRRENAPSDFFRIERNGNAYNLGYCPVSIGRPRCGNVGVSVENGRRLLALYVPVPLTVVFRRA